MVRAAISHNVGIREMLPLNQKSSLLFQADMAAGDDRSAGAYD